MGIFLLVSCWAFACWYDEGVPNRRSKFQELQRPAIQVCNSMFGMKPPNIDEAFVPRKESAHYLGAESVTLSMRHP